MEFNLKGLRNHADEYRKAGYQLPTFDYEAIREKTKARPTWIHFGVGNIFRAFPCHVAQRLLNEGVLDTGLIAAEGYDYEIIQKMDRVHDNLTILATLKSNNTVDKTVIGSVMETLELNRENSTDFNRLAKIFSNPTLQIVSFTITEKGYSLIDGAGNLLSNVNKDFEKGPKYADSYLGKVASLLYIRYQHDAHPIAMVSMDNCSHNGDKLAHGITAFADAWCNNGLIDSGFGEYLRDPQKVSFPWSMIDKITPRPDAKVEALLSKDGIQGLDTVITSKNTHIAPFVNAEECEYLVIEDHFPNGRPALEKGGILFTSRETVDKVEKMKVCTCLNPLHTTLAIFGCLLNYHLIADEMQNPILRKLVEYIGYQEGLPVVVHPNILDPKTFIDEVVTIRIPNPFLPDTPQRIATDTSQKIAIRFGETIKAYEASETLDVNSLTYIPLVLAGWLRYLMGVDDNGNSFTLSPDPLLDTVIPFVTSYALSDTPKNLDKLDELLSNADIFGVNLHTVGLAPKVKAYFAELSSGIGAVADTLEKHVGK